MPLPSRCPNPTCTNHLNPDPHWYRPYGWYQTAAHGPVRRFRCRACGTTCSTQTESMHFAAKRHLPLRAIVDSLLEGASQREIARRYRTSPMPPSSSPSCRGNLRPPRGGGSLKECGSTVPIR